MHLPSSSSSSSSSFSSSSSSISSSSSSTMTTTSTVSFLPSRLPTWLQRGIQVVFFPHYPPPSTSHSTITLFNEAHPSLLPTTTTTTTTSPTTPSVPFPCPKPPPRITQSWSRFFLLPCFSFSKKTIPNFPSSSFSSSSSTWVLLFRIFFFVCWFLGTYLFAYFHLYGCKAYHPELKKTISAKYISGTASYWKPKSKCGLMGRKCAPFEGEWEIYKCGALALSVKQLQEYFVGLNRVFEQPLLIGGANQIYRGDSFVCAAAVDAGIISQSFGGCVMVHTLGAQPYFNTLEKPSSSSVTTSTLNNNHNPSTATVPFSSYFPSSYQVLPCEQSQACGDLTFYALLFQIIFFVAAKSALSTTTATTSSSSSSGFVLYLLYMVFGFWHIILISDTQRSDPTYLEEAFTFFLPFLAVTYTLYHCITSTLFWLTSLFVFELFFFIVLPFFAGLHLNYWAALLPTFTFTTLGLKEQLPLFLSLVVLLLVLLVYFCYYQRSLHRLHVYLLGYTCFWGLYALVSVGLDLQMHFHHYLLAWMVLPVTRQLQSRFSWLVHFFLLGMFVHGSARWGMDGPFDTPSEALRGRDDPRYSKIVWDVTSFDTFSKHRLPLTQPLSLQDPVDDPSSLVSTTTTTKDIPWIQWSLPPRALPYASVTSYRVLCNDVWVNQTQQAQFNPIEYMNVWNVPHVFVRVSINETEVYSKPIQVFNNGTIIDTLLSSDDKVK